MNVKDWKLKLRYGKMTTPFTHFTILGNSEIGEVTEGFSCRPGPGYVGMKIWATDTQEAADIFFDIGSKVGFVPYNKVEVYETDAEEPPREKPYAYDITFMPYDENESEQ
jgi:hypothetical protein